MRQEQSHRPTGTADGHRGLPLWGSVAFAWKMRLWLLAPFTIPEPELLGLGSRHLDGFVHAAARGLGMVFFAAFRGHPYELFIIAGCSGFARGNIVVIRRYCRDRRQ